MTGQPPAYDWRVVLINIGGPRSHRDSRQSWLAETARRASITRRQAKAFWYGECIDPKSSLADKVREAEKQALSEASVLATQLEQNAERLDAVDADFYRPTAEAMRAVAKRLRGETG